MTLVWKSGYSFDSDASTYIDAVETADGQALETGVRIAINDFVLGCKQDEIWDAIKASCILAGARTLDGALVPLVGTAPTNNNFVSGDYDRETGLVGDGSTKYLDSNRNNNADPQNSNHNAIYVSTANSADPSILIGDGTTGLSGKNRITYSSTSSAYLSIDSRSASNQYVIIFPTNPTGLIGHSRADSSSILARVNQTSTSYNQSSTTPTSTNTHIFSRESGGIPTNARLSFYSIGESLDLAALDTRVSNLITAIGAAIP